MNHAFIEHFQEIARGHFTVRRLERAYGKAFFALPASRCPLIDGRTCSGTAGTIARAATNEWKPGADRDPATDTFASPDLWGNFADFYEGAKNASKLAQEASRTKRLDEFRSLIGLPATAATRSI